MEHVTQMPSFSTERFLLTPLEPALARQLVEVLLQDDALAEQVPWLQGKTPEEARQLAAEMEAGAEQGVCRIWSIMVRAEEKVVGALVARNSLAGIDVEVLVDSECEMDDLVDETCDPVMAWLDASTAAAWGPATLH